MAYSVVRDFVVDERDMRLHSTGVGTPVLMLHELAGSARSFAPMVPHLVAGGREAVALDLPGHGRSEAVPGSSLDGCARRVAAALDEVTTDPVDVVGVDFGGYLALSIASMFPDRVRRMVLVEPLVPPRAGRAPATVVGTSQRARGAFTVLRQGRHGLGQMHSVLDQLRTCDPAWWGRLAHITAPTEVIDGGHGTAGNGVDLDGLAAAIPDSKRISVAVGHRVWSADPRMFADLTLAFVTG
jgi:pimeloyl-ACP methyl ester carboxylesterase